MENTIGTKGVYAADLAVQFNITEADVDAWVDTHAKTLYDAAKEAGLNYGQFIAAMSHCLCTYLLQCEGIYGLRGVAVAGELGGITEDLAHIAIAFERSGAKDGAGLILAAEVSASVSEEARP